MVERSHGKVLTSAGNTDEQRSLYCDDLSEAGISRMQHRKSVLLYCI